MLLIPPTPHPHHTHTTLTPHTHTLTPHTHTHTLTRSHSHHTHTSHTTHSLDDEAKKVASQAQADARWIIRNTKPCPHCRHVLQYRIAGIFRGYKLIQRITRKFIPSKHTRYTVLQRMALIYNVLITLLQVYTFSYQWKP